MNITIFIISQQNCMILMLPLLLLSLTACCLYLNPFRNTDQKKRFESGIDPDETVRTSFPIRIYTAFFHFATTLPLGFRFCLQPVRR